MTEILRLIHFGDDKPGGNGLNESEPASLEALVAEYPDVWALSLDELDTTDTVKCTIPLHEGSQATQPSFRRRFTNPKHREFLITEVARLLRAGKICKVAPKDVTWVSNVTVAPKANIDFRAKSLEQIKAELKAAIDEQEEQQERGKPPLRAFVPQRTDLPDERKNKLRLCFAFLDLNDATKGAPFPVGDLDAKIGRLSCKKYYSCFDMCSGYLAVAMDEADVHKTTFAVDSLGYFAFGT
ncbi:hypothetical protein ACM66B_001071 [Microbotryomycetes sp. NB124-2]